MDVFTACLEESLPYKTEQLLQIKIGDEAIKLSIVDLILHYRCWDFRLR